MNVFMGIPIKWAGTTWIGLFFLACGSENGLDENLDAGSDPNVKAAWLTREELPSVDFKAAQIETTVDALVESLNTVRHNNAMKLSFIPKDLKGYFGAAVEGANNAFEELNVINTVVAPNSDKSTETRQKQQIDFLKKQIADRYQGIGVASIDADLVPEINEAVAEGLTVITFDSDEPTSDRQLYVGTINKEAGRTAGNTMLDLLDDERGTVLILGNTDPGWSDGYHRTHEARSVLEGQGYTVIVCNTNWENQSENEIILEDMMRFAEPDVVGCLGVFSNSFLCATAAKNAGMSDTIKIAAFDFEPQTVALMEEGRIHVTHVQRQYYMGYIIPYLLYSVNELGLESTKAIIADIMVDEERIDTGLDIVPSHSVYAYKQFLENL